MSEKTEKFVVDVRRSAIEAEQAKKIEELSRALGASAQEIFETRKQSLINKLRTIEGAPTAWVEDLTELTNPRELDTFEKSINLLEQERRANAPRELGTSPDSPPRGSVINANPGYGRNSGPLAKEEFNSAREMIDSVYDTEGPEAEKLKRQLWDRASPMIKKGIKDNVSISGCPRCNCGMIEGSPVCPSCGWDSTRAPLIELWRGREA